MELADGTLFERLRKAIDTQRLAGIPLLELLRHMRAAAEGLDYLNAKGTISQQPDGRIRQSE